MMENLEAEQRLKEVADKLNILYALQTLSYSKDLIERALEDKGTLAVKIIKAVNTFDWVINELEHEEINIPSKVLGEIYEVIEYLESNNETST